MSRAYPSQFNLSAHVFLRPKIDVAIEVCFAMQFAASSGSECRANDHGW